MNVASSNFDNLRRFWEQGAQKAPEEQPPSLPSRLSVSSSEEEDSPISELIRRCIDQYAHNRSGQENGKETVASQLFPLTATFPLRIKSP